MALNESRSTQEDSRGVDEALKLRKLPHESGVWAEINWVFHSWSPGATVKVLATLSYRKLRVLFQAYVAVGRIQTRIQLRSSSVGCHLGAVLRFLQGGLLLGTLITWQFPSSNPVGESHSPGC